MFSLSDVPTLTIASLYLCLIALTSCIAIDYMRVLRMRRRLPPGPMPLPLIGNYFHMRMPRPWIHWEHLAFDVYKKPLMTLWQGSRPVIVCSDAWTISDLFEKRASIYSSRPRMIMMGDMTNTTSNNQVCLKYNDQWRLHRRLTHSAVGSQVVRNYRGFQSDETNILLRDLLQRPEDYVMSIERYSCSIVSIIGFGRRIAGINDPIARYALAFMEVVNAVIPGQAMMEIMPVLARLPWWINPIPSIIGKASAKSSKYFYNLTKEAAETGAEASLSRRLISAEKESDLTKEEISNLTGNLIGGGVDTTSSSMISLILAMCVFPEKQRKAQAELDRVVGRDNMPDWSDEDNLPFITAVVAEVLRWRTVTILGGIPHAPIQDDEYEGYHIPKDTWVVGNVWAIHRNPKDYPEPDNFHPERFFKDDELHRPHPSKRGHSAFGWGRRLCSGQPLAEQGLWLVTARLLWAFELRPGLDEQGNEVLLDIFAYTASENQRPEPFKARFIPRLTAVAKMIEEDADRALRALSVYNGVSKVTME